MIKCWVKQANDQYLTWIACCTSLGDKEIVVTFFGWLLTLLPAAGTAKKHIVSISLLKRKKSTEKICAVLPCAYGPSTHLNLSMLNHFGLKIWLISAERIRVSRSNFQAQHQGETPGQRAQKVHHCIQKSCEFNSLLGFTSRFILSGLSGRRSLKNPETKNSISS